METNHVITTEEFGVKIDKIFAVMKDILMKKNESYGSASFQGGKMAIIGNMFRQKDKMNRYEHLITKMVNEGANSTDNPFGESVWDTVCDMFGYATIGLTILDNLGMSSEAFKKYDTEDASDLDLGYAIAQACVKKTEPKPDEAHPFGYDENQE